MKVVLTGGPCVGKSTLIRMLEALGYLVLPEFATEVINDGGPDPCYDHEAFQFEVLRRQRLAEARLHQAPLLFLDRGAPDGIPYREIYGRKVPGFFADLYPNMYDVCFLLDPLPWEADGVRYECADFTTEIQPYFGRAYENLDVPVVRVPVMANAEARLHFILDVVGKAMGRTLTTARVIKNKNNDSERQRRWHTIPLLGANASCAPELTLAKAG